MTCHLPAVRSAVAAMALGLVGAGCASTPDARPAATTATATASASATVPSPAATTAPSDRGVTFEHVTVGATTIEYAVVVPPGYRPGTIAPVVFAFPPGGQDHDTTERVTAGRWAAEARTRGWVVLSPVAPPSGLYYDGDAAALVPALLDALAATYPPEGGRFFLAGVSNGGLSAFRAALDHPDRFRALVVFPGYPPDPSDAAKLPGLAKLPVAMFVGGDDSGWREESERTKAALERLGGTVTLDVRAGEGHIITSLTGADLFDALERARSGR